MPDIDIDFDERGPGRRDQVRDPEMGLGPGGADRHLRHDQGQAAIKDACRVLGFPYALGDRITKTTRPPCWARTCR